MAHKRIGILTGGGDVPGLNMVIKSVVYRGAEDKCEVVGIRSPPTSSRPLKIPPR
jgi:ATP-dependent phosphofructokinase / diphosphate-dependent phosphofructokinase